MATRKATQKQEGKVAVTAAIPPSMQRLDAKAGEIVAVTTAVTIPKTSKFN